MQAQDIKYMKSATKSDIVTFIYDCLQDFGWKTSYSYLTHKPRKFFSKPLQISPSTRPEFDRYVNYCYLLSNNFTEHDEACRYRGRHGLSIYFSVVLYWLLVHLGVVSEKRLRLCQGYFCYKMEGLKPRYRAGLHAWLSCSGAIIDVTIWQQQEAFNFGHRGFAAPLITGEIPLGLSLSGFEEEKNLAKEYARLFARESGLTLYEWIEHHKKQADLLYDVSRLDHQDQYEADSGYHLNER